MPRAVFEVIRIAIIGGREEPFVQKYYCTGNKRTPGIFPLVRLCACINKMAYGRPDDSLDQYYQISETSMALSMKAFTRLIIEKFGPQYLIRCPTAIDTKTYSSLSAVVSSVVAGLASTEATVLSP
jgi:hypothetical protein